MELCKNRYKISNLNICNVYKSPRCECRGDVIPGVNTATVDTHSENTTKINWMDLTNMFLTYNNMMIIINNKEPFLQRGGTSILTRHVLFP